MQKVWGIFFLLISNSSFSNNCPDFYCQNHLSSGVIRHTDAREFEVDHKIDDEINTEDYGLVFTVKAALPFHNSYLKLEMPVFLKKDYSEFYAPDTISEQRRYFRINSFREPSLSFEHWFEHDMSQNFYHSVEVSYTPKLYRPSVYQFGNGRHEVKINYHYLNYFDKYFLEGNIYAKVFGRKKLLLSNEEIEVTPAYTEVATSIGMGFFNKKWRNTGSVVYGQTTNYSNKSDTLTHESDKGFLIGYQINFLRHFNENYAGEIKFMASSKIFNTIHEDRSKSIDFEKETSELEFLIYRNF